MKRRRAQKKNQRSYGKTRVIQAEKDSLPDVEKQSRLWTIVIFIFGWVINLFQNTPRGELKELYKLKDQVSQLEATVVQLSKQVKRLQRKREFPGDATTNTTLANVAGLVSAIPPPPPISSSIPPPPPPPVLSALPLQSNKVSSSTAAKVKSRGISILDLKSVKLKSHKESDTKEPLSKVQKMQVVTLKDLQGVQLRKRTVLTDENRNPMSPKVVETKLKGLRKTNMIRSPGGTPMVKRDMNTGQGLTPAFTKALKKKFESVKMSPEERSPLAWRC